MIATSCAAVDVVQVMTGLAVLPTIGVKVIDCAGSATEPLLPLAAKVTWPSVVMAGISVGALLAVTRVNSRPA